MRNYFFGSIVILALGFLGGCGQSYPEKDFGTIIEGIPKVKGADTPFEMPQLGPPPPEDPNPRSKRLLT
jgi:hypothetical protein